jgi:hypothetical protein
MAHGKSLELRYIQRPPLRWVSDGKTPFRRGPRGDKPSRADRQAAKLEKRRAARARAIANGLGARGSEKVR